MTVASEGDKPRVLSVELKKAHVHKRRLAPTNSLDDDARPKIAGELLWSATPTQWHVKLAEVRHGSLAVHCCSTGASEFRLPLHHLNVLAGRTPRTFTLATGHGIPLATFQTLTEEEYQRWVRVLAIEVLRQTPLQDVRFLDILGITRGDEGLRRGRSEECLNTAHHQTEPVLVSPRQPQRNKYNFREECKKKKERTEFSQWLHCVKRETEEENRTKNKDFDMKNMKIRRAQKVRPKLPFADTWNKLRGHSDSSQTKTGSLPSRSVSMDDLRKRQQERPVEPSRCNCTEEKKPVSDESGISSGDENNNTASETSTKCETVSSAESIYVSVREKKQFFESLSGEVEPKRVEIALNRSNSIGNIDLAPQPVLRRGQRASSMHDLSNNAVPVKEMRRFFENGSNNDLSKSFDELRFEDDTGSTIIEEDEGNSESDKQQDAERYSRSRSSAIQTPFVNPVMRKPKETVSYANIQVCRATDVHEPKSVRFSEVEDSPRKNSLQKVREEQIVLRSIQKINKSNEETPRVSEQSLLPIRESKGVAKCNRNGDEVVPSPSPMPEDDSRSETGSSSSQRDQSALMAQRKLQRGERKLGKLRIQIAEVEETIKHIADDLYSIGPNTLKRRSGLEVFAALRRRLEEETSRLERLQEETAKVISDNQRTILKMGSSESVWAVPNRKGRLLV